MLLSFLGIIPMCSHNIYHTCTVVMQGGKGKAGAASSGRHGGGRSVPGPEGAQKKPYKAKPLRYKNYGWHARLSSSESSELFLPRGEPVIDTALTDVGY